MSEPLSIDVLAKHAAALDPEDFASRIGLGALIGSLPTGTGEWAYQTEMKRKFSPAMPGIELASSVVFLLRKTQSTFKETVLIGRASSNDICLPYPSVSKLHARIRAIDGVVHVSDAGSSNGTEVGNKRITTEVPLSQGDYLDVGDCSFVYYTPRALYDALRALG